MYVPRAFGDYCNLTQQYRSSSLSCVLIFPFSTILDPLFFGGMLFNLPNKFYMQQLSFLTCFMYHLSFLSQYRMIIIIIELYFPNDFFCNIKEYFEAFDKCILTLNKKSKSFPKGKFNVLNFCGPSLHVLHKQCWP